MQIPTPALRESRPGGRAWARRGFRLLLVGGAALAAFGCATPSSRDAGSSGANASPAEPVLSEQAKRSLELTYLFFCAPELLVRPGVEEERAEERTAAARRTWEREKRDCLAEVAPRYTTIQAVRASSWNGSGYSLSDAEMRGIVRYGADYLEGYVERLLRHGTGGEQIARTDPEVATPPR